MPYKGNAKREYEKKEIETFHFKVPKFLATELREKLQKEGVGRTPNTFFVDSAAEFCGMVDKIQQRRSAKTIFTKLVSPDGEVFETQNLKGFCRSNMHLFPGHDVEIAYSGLSAARRRKGSWNGWRFITSSP